MNNAVTFVQRHSLEVNFPYGIAEYFKYVTSRRPKNETLKERFIFPQVPRHSK